MHQTWIPILLFLTIMLFGLALVLQIRYRRKPLEDRLRQITYEGMEAQNPKFKSLLQKIGYSVAGSSEKSSSLPETLARAGYHGASAVPVYLGIKVFLMALGFGLATAIVLPLDSLQLTAKLFFILLASTIFSFLPNLWVKIRMQQRHQDIRNHLPDAVDLLEICVSAGMGLDMAWNLVSEEIRRVSPVLADEMALANLEIHLGAPRADAMRHMSKRTGVQDLSSLAAVLIQTQRFGTSIADALKIFATSMRDERSFTAEENAEKMSVKLLFPMVLFIFPAVLIVVAGPAAILLYENIFPK